MAIKKFRKHVNLKLIDIILILKEKKAVPITLNKRFFTILSVVSLLFIFSEIRLLHRKGQFKIHNIHCDFLLFKPFFKIYKTKLAFY